MRATIVSRGTEASRETKQGAGARSHFRNRTVVTLVFGTLTLAAGAPAQNAPRPEALIKWRQSAFQVMAWNSARIKSALAGRYDREEVRSASAALAAVANAGLAQLFPPGTGNGKGWRETTARAAVFADAAKFRALSDEFARETGALAELATHGDANAVSAQFTRVARGCNACHDEFRNTD